MVLIVDDDDSIRESLEMALAVEGHRSTLARNGAEALAWLRQNRPSLILLDLMMPVMDGWELLDKLRADAQLASIPVVVITAFGKELGTAEQLPILRKPIELAELRRMVELHGRRD